MTTAAATNVQVAEAIGMTHSGVSRIRSGDRLPSVDKMVDIERVLKWSVGKQVEARVKGEYATEFERMLAKKFGAVTNDYPVPTAT